MLSLLLLSLNTLPLNPQTRKECQDAPGSSRVLFLISCHPYTTCPSSFSTYENSNNSPIIRNQYLRQIDRSDHLPHTLRTRHDNKLRVHGRCLGNDPVNKLLNEDGFTDCEEDCPSEESRGVLVGREQG